jgi:hypothetical protein
LLASGPAWDERLGSSPALEDQAVDDLAAGALGDRAQPRGEARSVLDARGYATGSIFRC